jgi:tRNA A37 threonylcarbamoyltransferase TsaD
LILFTSALELVIKIKNMKNLIIDATGDNILFKVITKKESYTSNHSNSRENFDKFVILLFEFLKENNTKLEDINNILINQGPGKYSSIRASIAIAKGLSIAKNINVYGFRKNQIDIEKYDKLFDLLQNGDLNQNLIKPIYTN